MYIDIQAPPLFTPYPSPPPASPTEHTSPPPSNDDTMSNKGIANVDGVGNLTYQRAIDIARNTEGDLDPTVNAYLEGALAHIWGRITAGQGAYTLNRDEFAVFNYYVRRFEGNPAAQQAVDRYWRKTNETPHPRR